MINSIEDLRSAGVLPTGPCSAWPQSRNVAGPGMQSQFAEPRATKVKAGIGKMAKGLVRGATEALAHGKVSKEIRDERWETCQQCPSLIAGSNRCAECGCFMAAKTWINADPKFLCPLQKFER